MSLAALLLLALLPAADVHGTVRAEGSGAPIPRATVQVVELKRTAATDRRGYFVLPGVEEGRWTVRASALGYRPHSVVVQASGGGSVRLDIDLRPEAVRLDPVEVRGREAGTAVSGASSSGPGAVRLEGRAVQSLPSVATISDFSTAPYVRGGSPDQSLITPSRGPRGDAVRESGASVGGTGAYGLFVGAASTRRRIVFVLPPA